MWVSTTTSTWSGLIPAAASAAAMPSADRPGVEQHQFGPGVHQRRREEESAPCRSGMKAAAEAAAKSSGVAFIPKISAACPPVRVPASSVVTSKLAQADAVEQVQARALHLGPRPAGRGRTRRPAARRRRPEGPGGGKSGSCSPPSVLRSKERIGGRSGKTGSQPPSLPVQTRTGPVRHSHQGSIAGDVLIRPAEVMRQFVDHHMGDQLSDRDIAALGPFVQDRAAEQPDQIGMRRLVRRPISRSAECPRTARSARTDRSGPSPPASHRGRNPRSAARLRGGRAPGLGQGGDGLMRQLFDQRERGRDGVGRWVSWAIMSRREGCRSHGAGPCDRRRRRLDKTGAL